MIGHVHVAMDKCWEDTYTFHPLFKLVKTVLNYLKEINHHGHVYICNIKKKNTERNTSAQHLLTFYIHELIAMAKLNKLAIFHLHFTLADQIY